MDAVEVHQTPWQLDFTSIINCTHSQCLCIRMPETDVSVWSHDLSHVTDYTLIAKIFNGFSLLRGPIRSDQQYKHLLIDYILLISQLVNHPGLSTTRG